MSEHGTEHGATTIRRWMEDFAETARESRDVEVSGGAEPDRQYAYLEYHRPDGEHSVLLFRVEETPGGSEMRAHRVQGSSEHVRRKVEELVPESSGEG